MRTYMKRILLIAAAMLPNVTSYGEPQKITKISRLLHYLYPDKGLLTSLRDEEVNS